MSEIKLKLCPFCGSSDAMVRPIRDGRQVFCKCGASSPPEFFGRADQPSADERTITAWNTRATPEVTEGMIERAAKAICGDEWDGTQPWDRKPESFKNRYRSYARAALASALQETHTPEVSDAMVDRACAAYRMDRGMQWTVEIAMRAVLVAALQEPPIPQTGGREDG